MEFLANLISVDKKYEIAIEMSLGQALQNIVTDTEEDAKKLIEYLREISWEERHFYQFLLLEEKN